MKKWQKLVAVLMAESVILAGGCGMQESMDESEPDRELVTEMSSYIEEKAESETETESEADSKGTANTEMETRSEEKTVAETAMETAIETLEEIMSAEQTTVVDVEQSFHPGEETVDIRFKMPKSWGYSFWDVSEEIPDWGFSIDIQKRDDANIQIWGQYGNLNVGGLYANGPEDVETVKGMKGRFYWEKGTTDDGTSVIQGTVVFETDYFERDFYGVSFIMPESVYQEESNSIFELIRSIEIRTIHE